MKKLCLSILFLSGGAVLFGADDAPQVVRLYNRLLALARETVDLTLQAGKSGAYRNLGIEASESVSKKRSDVQKDFLAVFDELKDLIGTEEIMRRMQHDLSERYFTSSRAMIMFHDLTRDDSEADNDFSSESDSDLD